MRKKSNYKIAFLGTPEFAVPSLKKLIKRYDVSVITQPDKFVGRKKILTPSPVKKFALKNDLRVNDTLEEIKNIKPDLAVVVAYGKIIPQDILNICPFFNLHPSLLPKYRGPAPIQYALLKGDTETGVTIIQLDSGMDTGPILSQEKIKINPQDNYLTLSKKLSEKGATLLMETIIKRPRPRPQKIDKKTVTKLIKREDGRIDLNKDDPQEIINKLRAFTPWPGIYTLYKNKRLKILKAHLKNGELIIDQLQLAGKKPLSLSEFERGYGALTSIT